MIAFYQGLWFYFVRQCSMISLLSVQWQTSFCVRIGNTESVAVQFARAMFFGGGKGQKEPRKPFTQQRVWSPVCDDGGELSTPNRIFIKNHEFIRTSFRTPTFCSACRGFIWGLIKQGHKCSQCNAAVHKKCIDKIIGRCTDTEDNSKDTEIEKPHSFKTYSYKIPTFCNHCGTLLWGLFKQGRKCEDCVLNVHHRCHVWYLTVCVCVTLSDCVLNVHHRCHVWYLIVCVFVCVCVLCVFRLCIEHSP
ncbi:protein kinase C delta type-like isoform X1 [Alosa alosa]|uniref:protein kinase C delta type-like isoform X1 n=1 Tax=Alosa alosa TaxID=278164 RepID=UPI0020150BA8|nr:protein kinase C delta type-like isoform X1 [Alosa alosa]